MGVDIDEARRNDQPARVDLASTCAEFWPDGGNLAVLHGDVGDAAWGA